MRQRLASFDTTVTVIFFLVMFSSACLIPVQSDTWWHLRAGQEMWTRHIVMLTDEFSYVARGAYWPNHEWLSEVIFFAAFRIGGMPGLTLLAAILITTASALSWRLMRGPATQKLLLMALAMTSIAPVWTVRPHVFSLVLTMTVLQLALWANLHGGVALGFVVLGGVAISQVWIGQRSRLPKLAIVIAGCFAATLATPLGFHLWTTIPQSIQKSMANGIVEWRPPALFGLQHLAFWIVLLLFAVTTVVRRRTIVTKEHAALTVVSLALLPLALRYNRNVTPFLLVAVPALSRTLLGEQLEPREPARERYGVNIGLMALCAAGCVVVISIAWSRPLARLKWHPISQPIVDGIR